MYVDHIRRVDRFVLIIDFIINFYLIFTKR